MQNVINLALDGKNAKKNKQNILILNYIEDCHYCHIIRDEVLSPMSKNSDYDNLIIKQIDGNSFGDLIYFDGKKIDGSEFSSIHKVDFYPTVLLFNPNGDVLEKIIGIANIEFYWHNLDVVLNKYA